MSIKEINEILERTETETKIKGILEKFDQEYNNLNYKKGIYIYGASGCGSSTFVKNILTEMNYNIIKYSTKNVRNKSLIQSINSENISEYNILELMNGKKKRIVILMEEIEGMNSGDKCGITALIKLIRQKKTKKQKLESTTMNPIICIGNYYMDKKIRELMKVCNVFELKMPTNKQVAKILPLLCPQLMTLAPSLIGSLIENYIYGDFHKIKFIQNLIGKGQTRFIENLIKPEFQPKLYNDNSKKITELIFKGNNTIADHMVFMNETDRTIVALLWHENVINVLNPAVHLEFYSKILENICFADFIDRITFQNQVWVFNEMSSLIKTFYNQFLLQKEKISTAKIGEIRFTKVLTKYSSEFSNLIFIYWLCQELQMDKKDMFSYFKSLKVQFGEDFFNNESVLRNLENTEITKLDLKRMSRFLQKNIKAGAIDELPEEESESEEDVPEDDISV